MMKIRKPIVELVGVGLLCAAVVSLVVWFFFPEALAPEEPMMMVPCAVVKATIDGPVEVEKGATVDFEIGGASSEELAGAKIILFPEGKATYWRVMSEWGTGKPVPVFQSFVAGDYMILLAYYDGKAVQMEKHEFRVLGVRPDPDPVPPPPPPPPPPVEDLWVLFLYESNEVDDTDQMANVLSSQKIRRLGGDKVDIDFVDADTEDEGVKKWFAYLRQEGIDLPVVVFVNERGELLAAKDWPASVEEAVRLVEEQLP